MRFWALLVTSVSVAVLAGCGGDTPSGQPAADSAPAELPTIEALDIGDAEFHISVEVVPEEAELGDNIKIERLEDDQGKLMLVNVTVNPPVPETLPIRFTLRSTEAFGGSPVAVEGVALRDDVEIGAFDAVVGAQGTWLPRRSGQDPAIWVYDVLEGLDEIPESMLVNARLALKLTDPGTDEAAIDPKTVEVAEGNRPIEFTNPVRINFVQTEAADEAVDTDAASADESGAE